MIPESRGARRLLRLGGIVASALLLGWYAQGGRAWPLGFLALVPWLCALELARSWKGVLLDSLLMTLAFTAAVFGWFATAIGAYTGSPVWLCWAALLLLAPVLQPQCLAFALVRHWTGRHARPAWRMLAGAAAWVGCEALWPKLFGDTLGHGLQPSEQLRQAADLGGAALLTVALLGCNDALALLLRRWQLGWRARWKPAVLVLAIPLSLLGYGLQRLSSLQPWLTSDPSTPALRIGMIQAAITDYDRRRRESGAHAVVREVLDTHFGMSHAAVTQQGAEALLWSETVYPTTFGQPQGEGGADFDREITEFVAAAGTPLLFGTYDREAGAEYNTAALLDPRAGLLGRYRKTHLFPLTEHVAGWLEGPQLRRWLPWTGTWQPGDGARVLPLRAADGRELNVVPLICLDAVDPTLAIDGARLGAQAIATLSNDAWFTDQPQGAELHLAVASFRSIETRMPQLRVTTNGLSALIDATGEVVVRTRMGDQAVLVGAVPIRNPPATWMVRWGDWVGRAALGLLVLLAVGRWALRADRVPRTALTDRASVRSAPVDVVLVTPFQRWLLAGLRALATAGLVLLAWRMLTRDGLQVNTLVQLQLYAATVVTPLLAAWALHRVWAGQIHLQDGHLRLVQRARQIDVPMARITRAAGWRWPFPGPGLQLHAGPQWSRGLLMRDPLDLLHALRSAGVAVADDSADQGIAAMARHRSIARHPWLDHAAVRYALFALLLALPAFRLHQHIAFGGTFGELYTYGLGAWLLGLLVWWGAWSLGLMLWAAVLRFAIEAVSGLVLLTRQEAAVRARRPLEFLGRCLFFLAVPVWLAIRLL